LLQIQGATGLPGVHWGRTEAKDREHGHDQNRGGALGGRGHYAALISIPRAIAAFARRVDSCSAVLRSDGAVGVVGDLADVLQAVDELIV
jgi:hypothetical protein